MIKIAFFDIDGTLLEMGNPHMSKSTLHALQKLQQKGIRIIIATGRSLLRMPELPLKFDGYINFNGQYCQLDKKVVYSNSLNSEDVIQIIKNSQRMGKGVGIGGKDFFGCNQYDERLADYLKNTRPDYPYLKPFEAYLNKTVFQMVVPIGKEEEHILFENTKKVKAVRWSNAAADIIPVDGGKEVGIKKVLEACDCTLEDMIAFGDGENDIPMLEMAGIGVAMGNASAFVKEHANWITKAVEQDGIEYALLQLNLI